MIWLDDLKVGDKVIIRKTFADPFFDEVARRTKTQIILKNTLRKYRATDGYSIGSGGWSCSYIDEPTIENIKQVVETQEVKRWRKVIENKLHTLQHSKLQRIMAIIEEPNND